MNNHIETKLIIGNGKNIEILQVINTEEYSLNRKMQVANILIGTNSLTNFYDKNVKIRFKNLNKNRIYNIYYVDENTNTIEEIELEEQIRKNLSRYLNNREAIEKNHLGYHKVENMNFDCCEFVYFIKGWGKGTKIYPTEKPENGINGLIAGDVICILNSIKDANHHLAIYIGKGLFLSKYGDLSMMISNYKQMANFYETNAYCKVINA